MAAPGRAAVQPAKASSQRPTTLHHKRTSSIAGMDIDDLHGPASPTKRARVQFSQDVEVRTIEEFDRPMTLVREEVSRALAKHKLGDSTDYLQIKAAFSEDANTRPSSELPSRQKLILAMTGNAAALGRTCTDLISAVLGHDWIAQDDEYVGLFQRFILVLVSANSQWLGEVTEMLVSKFQRPAASSYGFTSVSRLEAQRRIHHMMRAILSQYPHNGPVCLRSAIETCYPAQGVSTKAHVLYIHNLFKLVEYAPEIEGAVLSIITAKLVSLDMQIQNDIDEIDDLDELLVVESEGNLDAFMDSLKDEDDNDSDDEDEQGDDRATSEEEKAKAVRRDIQKMDLLMDLAFDYYSQASNGGSDAEGRTFDFLEAHFDAFLLPSFRSRHTQFLLFHNAQLSPDLIDRFVGTCLIKAMDKSKNAHVRQSAAAYLASFVARGNRVPSQIVRDVFAYIGDELADLRQTHEPNCRGPDLFRYGTYYSLVQALLYIFCFRWRDLELTPSDPGSPASNYNSLIANEEPSRHMFVSGIKSILDENILSPLNPLKVCSPVIVDEFAKVAHHVGILFIFPKIELNKRLRLIQANSSVLERESALTKRKDESMLQLDEYFPFDPYLLPRSKRWLQGDYRDFQKLPGTDDDDSESDSNLDDSEDEDDIDSASDSE